VKRFLAENVHRRWKRFINEEGKAAARKVKAAVEEVDEGREEKKSRDDLKEVMNRFGLRGTTSGR